MRGDPLDTTRRRFLTCSGLGLAGALAGCVGAPGTGEASERSLPAYLDDRVPDLLDYYDIPGAGVALVENGEVTWSGAYGEADREAGTPVTSTTRFRAASITKSITAWAVETLIESNEYDVELDDPIERHVTRWELPDSEYDTAEVTVRRLLSHTSGLQMGMLDEEELYGPDEPLPAPEEVLAGEAREPAARFERAPGSSFSYSNAGFVVLELLIEETTGRTFEEYVQSAVLEPLDMDDATFSWDDDVESTLATGYMLDGSRGPVFVDSVNAPGGLYATVDDIARFVAASTAGPAGEPKGRGVLTPAGVEELHAPAVETSGLFGFVSDAYGFGHFVETLPDGQRAVSHGGQHTGWLSYYYAVPETGDGIVVLTNSERAQRFLAQVVDAWADRQGLSSVAMGRTFDRLATAAKVTTGVGALTATFLTLRLGRDLTRGVREFDPLSRRSLPGRAGLAAIGLLAGGAWWILGRELLSPLLPVLSRWAEIALTAFTVIAILTVLFPKVGDEKTDS